MARDNMFNPSIGEVYLMQFSGAHSVQSGWRPGIIFQNNLGNQHSPNVIALPMTSSIKKTKQPTHVLLKAKDAGLRMDSMALCENPECVPKEMVGNYITTLSDSYMKKIAVASLLATSAISYLDKESMLDAWEKASLLNM